MDDRSRVGRGLALPGDGGLTMGMEGVVLGGQLLGVGGLGTWGGKGSDGRGWQSQDAGGGDEKGTGIAWSWRAQGGQ